MMASANRYLLLAPILPVLLAVSNPVRCGAQFAAVTDTLAVIKTHPMVSGPEWALMITDRQTYIAGDHIWYSMHVRTPEAGKATPSIIGYAELLNRSNMPVSQSRILLNGNGHGAGMMALSDTLSSGDYLLRGYTRAMIPYGPEQYFSKLIRVLNPYSNNTNYYRLSLGEPSGSRVELFTESGVTVPGAENRVVAKVTGDDGKGRAAEVVLSMPDGTPSDTIVTDMTGLGFALVSLPESGTMKATAVIDSEHAEGQLTVSRLVFHSLAVESTTGKPLQIRIRMPERSASTPQWPLHLAIISPGRVNYYSRVPVTTADAVVEIPPGSTGEGIYEALLFDNGGGLLSSRLFMTGIDGSSMAKSASVISGTESDSIRVTFPRGTEWVSLSVACDESETPDVRAWSLLEPWLNASGINDPFLKPFITASVPLTDELLITFQGQGPGTDVKETDKLVAETRGVAVTAQAIDLGTLGPAPDMLFFLNIQGKHSFLQYARSDNSGNFTFIVPPRSGNSEISIWPQDTAANIIIKLTSPFSHDYLPVKHSVIPAAGIADDKAVRMSINSQVMRIYDIPDTDTLPGFIDTSALKHFYGSAGQHLLLSDYIPLPNMEEVFFELVPGLELIKNRDRYSFRIFDPKTGKEVMEPPLMFIDGIMTTDPETIASLPADRTESIDAIIMRYRIGGLLLPPVISLITKKGDFRLQKLPRSALRINYPFTDIPLKFRPFAGGSNDNMPVLGNTLLWFTAPGNGSLSELSLCVPRPDYDSPVRLTSISLTHGLYPFVISEPADFLKR